MSSTQPGSTTKLVTITMLLCTAGNKENQLHSCQAGGSAASVWQGWFPEQTCPTIPQFCFRVNLPRFYSYSHTGQINP